MACIHTYVHAEKVRMEQEAIARKQRLLQTRMNSVQDNLVNMHTYIHTYPHTYIPRYIHTHIHTYRHTDIHTYIHAESTYGARDIHTHIHTYTDIYIHTYIHTDIQTYMHTYIHTYMQKVRMEQEAIARKQRLLQTRITSEQDNLVNMHTYIHTHIHTYPDIYIHTYIQTYMHTYIHTYMQKVRMEQEAIARKQRLLQTRINSEQDNLVYRLRGAYMCICMYVCMYVYMCVCV